MITDVYLRAARVATPIPEPTGAYALPGIRSILLRPTPGGAPLATQAEAVTPLKRVDYTGPFPTGSRVIASETMPVQPHTYAVNPRDDGTTSLLSASADVGTNSNTSSTKSAALLRAISANVARAAAIPATSGNDTGQSGAQAPALTGEPSGDLPWAALLILGFVAFVVLKKK